MTSLIFDVCVEIYDTTKSNVTKIGINNIFTHLTTNWKMWLILISKLITMVIFVNFLMQTLKRLHIFCDQF